MKWTKFVSLITLMLVLSAGSAFATSSDADVARQQTDFGKMLHKLGRGVTNVFTCWVEVPRQISTEWQKTDPVTGFFVGGIKGVGWGFARFVTGVYDTVTFPIPVPPGYQPMIEPEFVVTDVWGAPIPELTEMGGNDPDYPTNAPIYPQRFNF
jgi:putative exosortase-associated protein (TIGR04073 family)